MQASLDIDQAIRVVVAPSQASYFAGEPFVVTISISNLRTPQTSLTPRSVSHSPYTHKRGAHSVSYVPMARPPTSPGIRTALAAPSVRQPGETSVPTRRGIIGRGLPPQGAQVLPQPEQSKKRPVPNKSLSVSIAAHELTDNVLQDHKGKSPIRILPTQTSSYASPTSPAVSSPLARNSAVPINHPHARKHSVLLDGEVQVQDVLPSAVLPTPNPSTSSFSLSLDPITENNSPIAPATPSMASPITNSNLPSFRVDTVSSSTSAESALNRTALAAPPRKPPVLGLGNGYVPKGPTVRKSVSSSFSAPNSELILYSYAQLVGSLSLVSLSDTAPTPDQVRTLQTVRSALTKTMGVGGGSMDIASHTPQSMPYGQQVSSSRRPSHSRSSSFSVGLLSFLSPSTLPPPSPTIPSSHSRSQSLFSSLFGPSPSSSSTGLGIGLGDDNEPDPIDPEAPLPTFEVQPKMLAVDLALAPGESRCYTYTLDLPRNLPPTYRGRCLRFSYEFVLGVCRALPRPAAGSSSSSRVLKVPIRLYNHVVVDRSPSPYDLLWPVQCRGRPINVSLTETHPNAGQQGLHIATGSTKSTSESVRAYAKNLLATTQGNGDASNWPEEDRKGLLGLSVEETDGEPSCREAVEILTRNPKKLSYDVNKDGVKVAVLTFTKSAYRLGETVMGVIELNRRAGRSRVLKLSALLEAHESLPDNIAPAEPATSRHLRRVHAEQHSSFIANTLRTTFSLDIPPDASPAFEIAVGPPSAPQGSAGGLEWKVRLCLFVAVASAGAREGADGVRLKHLVRAGQPGAWGTSWRGAKTIAPSERPTTLPDGLSGAASQQSWTSFLTSTFLGNSEPSMHYHDGDEEEGLEADEAEAEVGAEVDWREVGVEMVECVVPIKVWPGNTAFKAAEVVLEV